jgi:hypothetical protein
MVKFLFAKEKTRVRFPLSAQGKVNLFTMIKNLVIVIVIVDSDSVVILSFAFFYFLTPPKRKPNKSEFQLISIFLVFYLVNLLVNRFKPKILDKIQILRRQDLNP